MVIKKCTKEVAGKALFRLFPIICFSDIQHDFLPNFFLISSKIYFQILKFKIQIYILKHFLKNLQNVVQCFSIILFFLTLFPLSQFSTYMQYIAKYFRSRYCVLCIWPTFFPFFILSNFEIIPRAKICIPYLHLAINSAFVHSERICLSLRLPKSWSSSR